MLQIIILLKLVCCYNTNFKYKVVHDRWSPNYVLSNKSAYLPVPSKRFSLVLPYEICTLWFKQSWNHACIYYERVELNPYTFPSQTFQVPEITQTPIVTIRTEQVGKFYKKEEEIGHKMVICALHCPLSSLKNTAIC